LEPLAFEKALMHSVLVDIRLALRNMRGSPRVFAAIFLALSCGMAISTAMLSVVCALLWPPLPFRDADRLTMIWATQPGVDRLQMSLHDFHAWKPRTPSLDRMAIVTGWLYSVVQPGQLARGVVGAAASGEFFELLGIEPQLGRWFASADDRPDAPPVAVLGAQLWRQSFGADSQVIGRQVDIDSRTYTVVGVAPDGFTFSYPRNEPVELWVPMAVGFPYYGNAVSDRDHQMYALGRLRAGATIERAAAELEVAARSESGPLPSGFALGAHLEPLRRELVGPARDALLLAAGAVALVFLALCFNVAGLLLTRTQVRLPEWALRAALGASSARLARQLATETLVLFVAAVPLSVLGASALVGVFHSLVLRFHTGTGNYAYELLPSLVLSGTGAERTDVWALIFCLGLSLLAGLGTGLIPARATTSARLPSALQESALRSSTNGSPRGLRALLVVAQIAAAFALLAGSGMALKGLSGLLGAPAGFNAHGLVALRFVGAEKHYSDWKSLTDLYKQFRDLVQRQPGVLGTAVGTPLPLGGYDGGGSFIELEGEPPRTSAEKRGIMTNGVGRSYFATMGIALLRGRTFSPPGEGSDDTLSVVVSKMLAEQFFPGQDPIGKRIRILGYEDNLHPIIGVVSDVRRYGLAQPPIPEAYSLLPNIFGDYIHIVARSEQPVRLMGDLPRLLATIDPQLGVAPWLMEENLNASVELQKLATVVIGAFASAVLLLAAFATYGSISLVTAQRTRELGIRMALGASPGSLIWLVMRTALAWLGLGLALGFVGALGLSGLIASGMVGGARFDAPVYAAVAGTLTFTVLLASLMPALRVLRASPATALKQL
jgi:putative ABC transport system permease protein